jgi:hypothetical protein
MKLGINSQDLQDIILTRLDSSTNMSNSSSRALKGKVGQIQNWG